MRGEFPETVPYGYCHCGCGQKTKIATRNHTRDKMVKGEPMPFIQGHHLGLGKNHPMYGKKGKDCRNWKGGRYIIKDGNISYVRTYVPDHPRSDGKYVLEHVLIAEKILGDYLPKGAVVHHIDGNGLNNNEDNLMMFPSGAEHTRFHRRHGGLGNAKDSDNI